MPNATSPFSGFEFLSKNHTNITSGVYSVLAISAALNIFTFPFAILLNSLVIVAAKTNRRLRTKSNISLACLATTDFAVGLINPLIYTARIRHFRVAIFQMVMRKTLAQAENLEKKVFGANRVGVA